MTAALKKDVQIVPSLLAADLGRLEEVLAKLKAAGVAWVSVDVMDGHFVPNLSFGPDHVRLAKKNGMTVDAHLMVDNPETVAPWFVEAGADIVTAHIEAVSDAARFARAVRARGARAGLALRPKTPAKSVSSLLGDIDLVLIMTVDPGFGGAHFIESMLPKISEIRTAVDAGHFDCRVQVDGGINEQTAPGAVSAGADVLVAGTAIFKAGNPAEAAKALERRIRNVPRDAGRV